MVTNRRTGGGRSRCRAVALLAVSVVVGALAGCGGGRSEAPPPTATPAPKATPTARGGLDPAHLPAGWSLVAWPSQSRVPVFAQEPPAPDGAARPTSPSGERARVPTGALANPNAQGAPLALLVEHYSADWLKVSLPLRPNGTTGWIRTAGVKLLATRFSLVVDRSRHLLTVYQDNRVAKVYPVGIGTGTTPTPTGRFYLAELLRPAYPAGPWGPYAFGLSGFSDVLTTFNGADGIIGLHGTDDPSSVGSDVSHGCIRLRNADITRLADVIPVGTPVTIV